LFYLLTVGKDTIKKSFDMFKGAKTKSKKDRG